MRKIGKFKAGQNRLEADAAGAVAGLRERGSDADLAMATLIERARGWNETDAAPAGAASDHEDS